MRSDQDSKEKSRQLLRPQTAASEWIIFSTQPIYTLSNGVWDRISFDVEVVNTFPLARQRLGQRLGKV